MATNITTTGTTPVVLRQRQHPAPSSTACRCSVSSAVQPHFRLVEGRYLPLPAATCLHGVDRRGPIMSDLTGTTMSGDRSTTRGSDATNGKFSTRSGFRSCSPPV